LWKSFPNETSVEIVADLAAPTFLQA